MDEHEINPREARQYYDDLYLAILGSQLKNGHSVDPNVLINMTDLHWKALVKHMKKLNIDEI